jgi:hypothetical protein
MVGHGALIVARARTHAHTRARAHTSIIVKGQPEGNLIVMNSFLCSHNFCLRFYYDYLRPGKTTKERK